jgi:nicotinamide phosphoribosyltransferase
MRTNLLLNTDSYKASHWLQYPPGTEYVYSYIESRGGQYDKTVFFGLQAFIKEYLTQPICLKDIEEAEEFWQAHGEPFNKAGWVHILRNHGGYLPLRIEALPEGMLVPTGTPLVTVINTDPACFWLTSYVETALLRAIWYPTTVATQSFYLKQMIKSFLEDTGDLAGLPFKLHDFGARGVSSNESAMLGGMAHLVNFQGSDTVMGVVGAKRWYNEPMAAFSIPAAEHSTITTWGKNLAGETAAYENMLNKYAKPGAILAVVSDSYDIYNACEKIWGETLRQKVIDSGATLVIRPDSGDPVMVTLRCAQILDEKFGHTINDKGFKVLNNVRLIQGDGVNPSSINAILMNFKAHGYSADNIAFGMGGGLLQHLNRDTQKFAMKASAIRVNGQWRDVSKSPIGQADKASKGGRFTVLWEKDERNADAEWSTIPYDELEESMLVPVFENGKLLRDMKFAQVRYNTTL